MANALIALRHKYAEDLEEILQCPVCFESLAGTVPMCIQGHHVCMKCQPQMLNCPLCKGHFNGTRNYLAEALMTKFDEIKISLIDPKNYINKKVIKNMMCVQTQTDPSIFKTNAEVTQSDQLINNHTNISIKENSIDLRVAPTVGKGKYPCKIDNCCEELPHGRMIPHIRYYHKQNLVEVKVSDHSRYEASWVLQYNLSDTFNRAISIPNMGLFFLNISIGDDGNLNGNLQIVNTCLIAKQFHYSLQIGNSHSSTGYKGPVLACRTTKSKLNGKSLFVSSEYMEYLLKKKRSFKCDLILIRGHDSDFSLQKSKSSSSSSIEF